MRRYRVSEPWGSWQLHTYRRKVILTKVKHTTEMIAPSESATRVTAQATGGIPLMASAVEITATLNVAVNGENAAVSRDGAVAALTSVALETVNPASVMTSSTGACHLGLMTATG
jgi:hypothetical protein